MKNNKILFLMILISTIIIILIVAILVMQKQIQDYENKPIEERNEGGVAYDISQLKNVDISIEGLTKEITKYINNTKEFNTKIKEYIYINGLVDASVAKVIRHDIIAENNVKIYMQLNDINKTVLSIDVNAQTSEVQISATDNSTIKEQQSQEVTWKEVADVKEYYAVKNVVDRYFEYIEKYSPNYKALVTGAVDESLIKEATELEKEETTQILKIILNNYINNNNISDEKLEEQLEKYAADTLNIEKMYYKDQGNYIYSYYIQGNLHAAKSNYHMIVLVDKINKNYTILPNEYILSQFGQSFSLEDVIFNKEMLTIKQDLYNTISYEEVSLQNLCMYYLGNYMYKIKTNPQEAYNVLDEQYKQKRFESYEKFAEYIKQNYNNSIDRVLSEYSVYTNEDGITTYFCKDQYNNVYIFKELAIMNYTLQLDDYTLENTQFNEAYAKSTNMDKGMLNCDKFFKMINMQDYAAAYKVLDENFKQTYFKTEQSFEEYVKAKLFKYNVVTYEEYNNNISSIHAYKIKLTNATGLSSAQLEFNIVMKLLEGTDFVMSFEVN